jgi:plasmid stabilization system protein ParE
VRITWSPLAIQRVLEAAEFIARDKPGAAQSWAESTFEAVERLADLPNSGRVVPEIRRPEIREIIHGAFRIIYRIESDQVLVLTVRRGRRLLDPSEIEGPE